MKGSELVAWNLRRLRVDRGWSQDGLALEAGVDRTYVGRLERRLENPTVSVLDRLAAALDAPIAAFFIEPREGETPPASLRPGRKAVKDQSSRLTKTSSSGSKP
jgi:transcriptional regulator with XRE-family HTH domain